MQKPILLILAVLSIIGPLWADSLDSTFSTPTDLTDKDAKASQEFMHEGLKDKKIQEGCANQGLGKCNVSDTEPTGFMGVLEERIGMAYTAVFGGISLLSGNGPKINMNTKTPGNALPADQAGPPKPENKTEERNDYCMYGAIGWETLAGLMQANLQSKAQQETSEVKDAQVAALVNLKEAHNARAKTATYQSTVYAAVTACYIGYGVAGATKDWKYWAKLGGATALTTLYLSKAQKHKDAAGKVQKVIDSLPSAGDCNPWTGTSCFCKETTSEKLYPSQYQEVCVVNNGDFETPKIKMGCGVMEDGKMQFDKECKCKQSNSCFTTPVRPFNPKFNLGSNLMNHANSGFDLLGSGEFDEAKLTDYSTQTAAMAMKLKNKAKVKAPRVNLTAEQKKTAEMFKEMMPENIASLVAAAAPMNPPSGGLMRGSTSAALDKLPDTVKKKLADAEIKANYKSGGSSASSSSDEDEWTPPVMPGKETTGGSGTEVINFAEKAISKADVSNSPDTPIFDIISNRYRRSGWEKLIVEEQIK